MNLYFFSSSKSWIVSFFSSSKRVISASRSPEFVLNEAIFF
ncbi:hypothetical protein LEP1GSC038_2771 [Leptospira weilii str. 2006001855]|uniref:Uncharacterized protein n=1 Tax=Leptospira weilii str. 2006001855 TaxID=996804 RepID=M6FQM1_9LEPT|nr:hypothetical protein LEP1GSC038_2771 [Leptospira weilii str. 2006001855]